MGENKEKTCFIVCPISDESSETRKRSDTLLKHLIKPVCEEELKFKVIRIDQYPHSNSITAEIVKKLNEADLVIADTTDNNPNCFYEIGYRSALSKPLILIRDSEENIPFDVAGINIIDYKLNDLDAADNFKSKLKETISILDFSSKSESKKIDNSSDETLNKIFNLLLTIDNKVDKFNSNIISEITKNFVSSVDKKNENEVMLQFLKTVLANPKSMQSLITLGKFVKDQEE
ncbi:hypothetical protein [Fusobacterium nucleatum]|uniref:hypothetical protein n=1 Tax=Fusobacterium nucleatum TaxID=851 RepID=UPI0030D19C5D